VAKATHPGKEGNKEMDIFFYIVLELAIAVLVFLYIKERNRWKRAISVIVQLELDKHTLIEKLAEEMQKTNLMSMESNNDFIKFLSASRDAAFGYIEDVQGALNSFIVKMDKQMKYYHTYGQAIDSPHSLILEEISKLYDDLKKVMPESNM
jgi:hypothetical protein